MAQKHIFVGTAGWSIAAQHRQHFPAVGTALERYSRVLHAAEINSSFYRPHRFETYQRWADAVSEKFRFAVKLPKAITHEHRLKDCAALLDAFFEQASGLGEKLGVVLVQLPPSLRFEEDIAEAFLGELRAYGSVRIALEPRHESWFQAEANAALDRFGVARVAADPARFAGGGLPGGSSELAYFRLHGSPRVYYSNYSPESLRATLAQIEDATGSSRQVWCIFDNTAQSHAVGNALDLSAMIQ